MARGEGPSPGADGKPPLRLHPVHLKCVTEAFPSPIVGLGAAEVQKQAGGTTLPPAAAAARRAAEVTASVAGADLQASQLVFVDRVRGCLLVPGFQTRAEVLEVPILKAEVAYASTSECLHTIAVVPHDGEAQAQGLECELGAWLLLFEGSGALLVTFLDLLSALGAIRCGLEESFAVVAKELGSGGCATVYLAHRRSAGSAFGKPAAIKLAQEAGSREDASLLKEMPLVVAAQGHPNVVGFLGLFRVENVLGRKGLQWAVALELCPGGDLQDLVARRGPRPEATCPPLIRGVLSALAHVHSRGIVHRDVKSENILLAEGDRPILTDFGIAARLADQVAMQVRCGSAGYVAPEVLRPEKKYDTQADIFGVGVTLFLLLSATLPFQGADPAQTLRRNQRCRIHLEEHRRFDTVSAPAKELMMWLLRANPLERPTAVVASGHPWLEKAEAAPAPEKHHGSARRMPAAGPRAAAPAPETVRAGPTEPPPPPPLPAPDAAGEQLRRLSDATSEQQRRLSACVADAPSGRASLLSNAPSQPMQRRHSFNPPPVAATDDDSDMMQSRPSLPQRPQRKGRHVAPAPLQPLLGKQDAAPAADGEQPPMERASSKPAPPPAQFDAPPVLAPETAEDSGRASPPSPGLRARPPAGGRRIQQPAPRRSVAEQGAAESAPAATEERRPTLTEEDQENALLSEPERLRRVMRGRVDRSTEEDQPSAPSRGAPNVEMGTDSQRRRFRVLGHNGEPPRAAPAPPPSPLPAAPTTPHLQLQDPDDQISRKPSQRGSWESLGAFSEASHMSLASPRGSWASGCGSRDLTAMAERLSMDRASRASERSSACASSPGGRRMAELEADSVRTTGEEEGPVLERYLSGSLAARRKSKGGREASPGTPATVQEEGRLEVPEASAKPAPAVAAQQAGTGQPVPVAPPPGAGRPPPGNPRMARRKTDADVPTSAFHFEAVLPVVQGRRAARPGSDSVDAADGKAEGGEQQLARKPDAATTPRQGVWRGRAPTARGPGAALPAGGVESSEGGAASPSRSPLMVRRAGSFPMAGPSEDAEGNQPWRAGTRGVASRCGNALAAAASSVAPGGAALAMGPRDSHNSVDSTDGVRITGAWNIKGRLEKMVLRR